VIHGIDKSVHTNLKLIAIAEGKHMYQLAEELLAEALEARRLPSTRDCHESSIPIRCQYYSIYALGGYDISTTSAPCNALSIL